MTRPVHSPAIIARKSQPHTSRRHPSLQTKFTIHLLTPATPPIKNTQYNTSGASTKLSKSQPISERQSFVVPSAPSDQLCQMPASKQRTSSTFCFSIRNLISAFQKINQSAFVIFFCGSVLTIKTKRSNSQQPISKLRFIVVPFSPSNQPFKTSATNHQKAFCLFVVPSSIRTLKTLIMFVFPFSASTSNQPFK